MNNVTDETTIPELKATKVAGEFVVSHWVIVTGVGLICLMMIGWLMSHGKYISELQQSSAAQTRDIEQITSGKVLPMAPETKARFEAMQREMDGMKTEILILRRKTEGK